MDSAEASRAPWWAELPPAAGAFVMATCIISVGLHLAGYQVLSAVWFAVAATGWVLLAGEFAWRLLRDLARFEAEADTPPALTAVAATTVLGVRISLYGAQAVSAGLLALATLLWPVLMSAVLRHQRRWMPGAVFLVCVATEGLAVLGATLAAVAPQQRGWLADTALAFFLLGLLLYLEALFRFDGREVTGGRGDHWIAAGALAIAALAASKLLALSVWPTDGHRVLRGACFVLLGLDYAWCAVLAVAEAHRPRRVYDIRRWSTVFPLGMTAAATLSVSVSARVAWLWRPGGVVLWVALATWVLTAAGLVRSAARSRQVGDAVQPRG